MQTGRCIWNVDYEADSFSQFSDASHESSRLVASSGKRKPPTKSETVETTLKPTCLALLGHPVDSRVFRVLAAGAPDIESPYALLITTPEPASVHRHRDQKSDLDRTERDMDGA